MEHEEQEGSVAQSTSVHLTTSAADFSKETLVVKEEETHDAGVFERAEAEVAEATEGAEPPSSSVLFLASGRHRRVYD